MNGQLHAPESSSAEEEGERSSKMVTARQFGAYRCMQRVVAAASNHLLRFRRLFQEWVVDIYCTVEAGRLNYFRHNQDKIRASLYQGVADAVSRGDHDLQQVGQRVVLPSTFQGGPRHMQQQYQDAMATMRRHGKPDLFITFTHNPKCPEV